MNLRVLWVLSLGHLAVDVTAGALPATLPFLQSEFHLSYFWLAALVMTSGITSSIVQPIFGVASDIAKARYFLPAGVLLALAGFAAIGLARNYGALVALVALAGFGSAMFHPEGTKCARAVSGRLRTTGMSYFGVGGNVGVAIGPLIVTALIAWHGLLGMTLLVVPGLAMALVVATVLPAIARAQTANQHAASIATGNSAPGPLAILIASTALRSMVYGGLLTFVPLYAVNVLHEPATNNGILLFLFLGAGATATLIAGPLADRHGAKATLSVSLALAAPSLALYLLSSGVLALAGLVLAGAFTIGTFSTTVVMGHEYLPNRVALASGLLIGFTSGVGGLGVGALGKIADSIGLPSTLWVLVGASVLACLLTLALPSTKPAYDLAPEPLV